MIPSANADQPSSRPGWDSHHRLGLAALAALALGLGLPGRMGLLIRAAAAWDGFAFVSIALAWVAIATQDPFEMRRRARLQDAGRTFLFAAVLAAALASLLGVGLMLRSAKLRPGQPIAAILALAVGAVALSWILVHTLFAFRYAHRYYEGAKTCARHEVLGGLIFPGKDAPDYWDFAYFSFVVGMTCQVSDVQIASQPLRRLALFHGLIAFGFNTAILALCVNVAAGLLP